MNTTALKGEGEGFSGSVKQAVGNATSDKSLQSEGIADQFASNAKQIAGAAKDALANPAPVVAKAQGFAKARPFAAADLFGVVGFAVLNTLRGK